MDDGWDSVASAMIIAVIGLVNTCTTAWYADSQNFIHWLVTDQSVSKFQPGQYNLTGTALKIETFITK